MKQHGGAPTEPTFWQPMKAYQVSFSGDVTALSEAAIQCGGMLYSYGNSFPQAILVVPAGVSLARIQETLESGGSGTILLRGEELGPP